MKLFTIFEICCDIWKIIKWNFKTFPNTTPLQQLDKVQEEIGEFVEAFINLTQARSKTRRDYWERRTDEEIIDVIISAINCMRYPEIREKVRIKMEINKHRTYVNNHHIEKNKKSEKN